MTKSDAIRQAIKNTGNMRGSAHDLKIEAEKLYRNAMWQEYTNHERRLLEANHNRGFDLFRANLANQYHALAKQSLIDTVSYKLVVSVRKELQRKSGYVYDARTYRDVPQRNILEPNHPAFKRKAA